MASALATAARLISMRPPRREAWWRQFFVQISARRRRSAVLAIEQQIRREQEFPGRPREHHRLGPGWYSNRTRRRFPEQAEAARPCNPGGLRAAAARRAARPNRTSRVTARRGRRSRDDRLRARTRSARTSRGIVGQASETFLR